MASYKIEFKGSAEKELKCLPKDDQIRVLRRISLLADDQRPDGCKKLSGQERYRIRHGNYRVLYEIIDDRLIVVVVKVGNRGHVYQ